MFVKILSLVLAVFVYACPAIAAAQEYRVEGRLMFQEEDGRVRPASHLTAHIYDRDIPPDSDDLLCIAITDKDGRFCVRFKTEQYQDIYVRFLAANSQWKITNPAGITYEWQTKVYWDCSSEEGGKCLVNIGTFIIGRASSAQKAPSQSPTPQNVGALRVFDAVRQANDFCRAHGIRLGRPGAELQIQWPCKGNASFALGRKIKIAARHTSHRDIIIHEIGHFLMNDASRIPRGAGGRHRVDKSYTAQLAWSEGWATFFAACVLHSKSATEPRMPHFGGGISMERVPRHYAKGDRNEMRVAAALWDLYDTVDDGTDKISIGFHPIWDVLARSNGRPIQDMREFILLLIRHGNADEKTIAKIHEALVGNTIHYDLDEMLRARK